MAIVKSGSFVVAGTVGIKNEVEIKQKQVKIPSEIDDSLVETAQFENVQSVSFDQAEVDKIFEDAYDSATKIIDSAKATAEKTANEIVENAKAEALQIQKQASDEGFKEGFELGKSEGFSEGKAQVSAEMQEHFDSLEKLLSEINENKSNLFEKYENDLIETIFEISQKIVLDSLNDSDKDIIRKTVKNAAKHFRTSQYLKISLCNNEYNRELASDEEFLKEIAGNIPNIEIELLKDAEIGTVILDNGNGITDASISVQLKMIEELGKGRFKSSKTQNDQDSEI